MATLTGTNLLDSIIDSTGIEPNALIYATLSAKLQQLIDNGNFSKLAASLAISGFSTQINAATEALDLADTIEANVALIQAAADDAAVDAIDFPDYGGVAPITYTLTAGANSTYEGEGNTFTVTASAPVEADTTVTFQLVQGTAGLDDFNAGSFNPLTATILAGETTASVSYEAITNDGTEVAETYSVTATIDGVSVGSVDATILDGSVGAGQTFTLTKDLDVIPGMIGSNGNTVNSGNDTIIGVIDVNNDATATVGTSTTLNATDLIDAGDGSDLMKVVVAGGGATVNADYTVPTNFENVETLEVRSTALLGTKADGNVLIVDTTAVTGLENVNLIKAGDATEVTVAATTNVDASMKAADAALSIDGGNNVNVALTDTTDAANAVTIGANTAVAGTIDVSSTGDAIVGGTGAVAMGAIVSKGGTTVNITQDANSVSGNAATAAIATDVVTTGAVTVTGTNATTSVNIDNGDQVTAVAALAGVAGVNQTQIVTFSALNAGQTAVVNGLTFTAAKNLTAEEVAQAFANLTNGDRQDDGGPTANGFYTGQNTTLAYTSGAANGATVTYSAATQSSTQTGALTPGGTGTNPTVAAGVAGVTKVTAVTGVAGVTNDAVIVDDNATASITDITVNGYAGGATLGNSDNNAGTVDTLDALQNLTLKNSGVGIATLSTASTGALNLTLDDVDANVNLDGGAATLTNLTVNTEGTASTASIIAAAATTVTINAEASLTAGANTALTAATSVDVNGSAAVNLANNGFANNTTLQTINAADNTGGFTVTLGAANRVAITGGTGNDTVNLAQTLIATGDNIALGAGNDTLNFTGAVDAGTFAAGVTLSGGAGDADVIGLTSTRATTETTDAVFEGFINGFEILSIGQTAANTNDTADLANMDDISHVRYANATTAVKASTSYAAAIAAATQNDTINFVSNGVDYTATIGATAGASATVAEIQSAIDAAVGVAGQVIASDNAGDLVLTALGNDTLVSGANDFVDADGGPATINGVDTGITVGTGSEIISNMANNGTLELQGSGLGATVQMTDSTGAADTFNIILDDSLDANGFVAGTVTTSASAAAIVATNTSGVETVNISVDDTVQDANNDGVDDVNAAFFLTFAEQTATATKLDIGGAGDLNLTTAAFVANAPLVTVDASDMAGKLVYTANNANMTVTGGSGNDTLSISTTADGGTFNGGAGNDTFVIDAGADTITLNGGAGAGTDTFDFNGVSTTDSNYAVIQNVSAGDTLDLNGLGVNAFNATAVTLSVGATQSTQAYQEAAMNTLATNAAGWFQYDNGSGVNTFIVADRDGNASYDAGTDATIMLVGAVDLSTASFNTTSGTIEIA